MPGGKKPPCAGGMFCCLDLGEKSLLSFLKGLDPWLWGWGWTCCCAGMSGAPAAGLGGLLKSLMS